MTAPAQQVDIFRLLAEICVDEVQDTLLRPATGSIKAVADYAAETGVIRFYDQTVSRNDLATFIASIVKWAIDAGVPQSEICVIAPRWTHVTPLARALMKAMPDVDFDAPGLSPLHSNRDDIWFKLARLALTGSRAGADQTRHRWASDFVSSFERSVGVTLPESISTSRRLLRFLNGIESCEVDGLPYLREVFTKFIGTAGVDLTAHPVLAESQKSFFAKAEARINSSDHGIPTTVESLRKLFRGPAGVVVNTCHGVKGEEYHTVIALGLLHGFVPHWNVIYGATEAVARDQASKLLYVVCSRAKKSLFLISESDRYTLKGKPYKTAVLLKEIQFAYGP